MGPRGLNERFRAWVDKNIAPERGAGPAAQYREKRKALRDTVNEISRELEHEPLKPESLARLREAYEAARALWVDYGVERMPEFASNAKEANEYFGKIEQLLQNEGRVS